MTRVINSILFALVLLYPLSASAQRRMPATDSAAVGGDVGVFIARAGGMGSGPTLEGFYEYYFEPRTSVRLGMGWANPSLESEDEDTRRYVRVAGDLVRNWEGGTVHPFLGAGLAVYFIQQKDNGRDVGDQNTEFGGTLFGGAEFFAGPTFAVKAEARYHVISNINGFNPDGLSLTIGAKKYF